MLTDEAILAGCISKIKSSEDLLYKKFSAVMYAICLRYTGNKDDAKDVFQDGFIKVYQQIKNFKQQGSLEGWMKRIMVNTAIDYCKNKSKIKFTNIDYNNIIEEEEPINIFEKIPKMTLLQMISELPDGYRLVFNLYAIEKYSHKEIAKELNIEEGTSKSQLFKARKMLQVKVMQVIATKD